MPDIRWGTIIPLIGGSALGCYAATGTKPLFHLSYPPFKANEIHIRRYWPDIPYILIDEDGGPKTNKIPPGLFHNIDFINTVCPCSGLSMLNLSRGDKRRGGDAIQNHWMIKTAVFVLSTIKPKCFWGENAPGLFSSIGEKVLNELKHIGQTFNYTFSVIKTDTSLHGIPQRRVRTFYFFWQSPTVPILNWINKKRKSLIEYLREIPKDAPHQTWYMTEGKASRRFKPYQFVLLREGLTHAQFFKKFNKGTITQYLFANNLIEECIHWLKDNCPDDGFYTKAGKPHRTFVYYLEHCMQKVAQGLGYWDDSPRFVGRDMWPAMIRKSMISAVHPDEDRFLNVREMMHLMGLPHDFVIDKPRHINHIAQNVPVSTAEDYAGEVVKFCRGEAMMSKFTFMKQDNLSRQVIGKERDFFPSRMSAQKYGKKRRLTVNDNSAERSDILC